MKLRAINPAELLVLALLAGATAVLWVDVGRYSWAARLVPVIFIGITAALLALRLGVLVHRAVTGATPDTPPPAPADTAPLPGGRARPVMVIAAVLAYPGLIYLLGLYAAILVYVIAFARLLGRIGWPASLAAGAGTSLAAYVLFGLVLGLPQMRGVIW